MANTTVTKVSEMMLTNVTAGVKAGEQKVSEDGGFTKVLNDAKDSTANVANFSRIQAVLRRPSSDVPAAHEALFVGSRIR